MATDDLPMLDRVRAALTRAGIPDDVDLGAGIGRLANQRTAAMRDLLTERASRARLAATAMELLDCLDDDAGHGNPVAVALLNQLDADAGVMITEQKLPLIGYDYAIVRMLAKVVHTAAAKLGAHTDLSDTRRGQTFDVRMTDGIDAPTGHVIRVTVELDRVDP